MAQRLTDEHMKKLPKLAARAPKRAVALGGGGPAVGISIGFLQAVETWNDEMAKIGQDHRTIDFPVWVAGCVGGWLSCLYHLAPKPRAVEVEKMIRGFFRETDMYDMFPVPKTFTPDIPEMMASSLKFFVDPTTYHNLIVPEQITKAYNDIMKYYLTPSKWERGDFCYMLLNSVFAPSPVSRFLMSLMYKQQVNGLNKIYFGPEYSILEQFDLSKLVDEPHDLYINSYNLDTQTADIYTNHLAKNKQRDIKASQITMDALCASSALPYVLQPVEIGGELHMEGALIDSFCFEAIHQNHSDLNEIWVSRIVDHSQVKEPTNLLEALNNLIMLYAGTTSKHDIEIFVNDINRQELVGAMIDGREPDMIEILQLPVESTTTYFWSYENLDNSVRKSKASCLDFIRRYDKSSQFTKDHATRTPHWDNVFSVHHAYRKQASL